MKHWFKLLALLLIMPLAHAGFDEGIEYRKLANEQPVDGDGIEVRELFWYGCPHCYFLEPELHAWLEKKSDDVVFVRMPAVLGPSWELLARAFYTAELLGVTDKTHPAIFARIHKDRKRIRNADDVKKIFLAQGVSEQDFDNTYKSFAVITRTNRAKQAARLYGITGVPTLVVNGKYRTTAQLAGGNKQMLEVVDFLIEKERNAKAGAAQPAGQPQ